MVREPHTTDITGEMILLGTGTSVGVPMVGCGCAICTSDDSRNRRTRCSAVLGLPGGNLLIDTPPDLRTQLLRENVGVVHSVVYTHEHADHIFGLDDLRLMQFYLGGPVPLYGNQAVERRIRQSYDYAFDPPKNLHAGGTPKLTIHAIDDSPFDLLGARITPIPLRHGPNFETYGYRIGAVAYCTDTNGIPPESMALLTGLDVLVLDALRKKPHSTHFGLDEAVEVATELQPRQTYFTHVGHELDFATTNADLPDGMDLAFDGLRIALR